MHRPSAVRAAVASEATPSQEWRDHPAKFPSEVVGMCRTCADLQRLLSEQKWEREGRDLLRGRRRGQATGFEPVGEVFKGFTEEGESMKIGAAFPGNYLKAADLQGRRVQVVIEKVEMEDIGGDTKPVVHFRGKDRGLVLNKTNANAIWGITGSDDTDDWDGVEITLYPSKTDFQGKRVDCIRVDPPDRAPGSKGKPQPRREPEPEPTASDDDDSIPF